MGGVGGKGWGGLGRPPAGPGLADQRDERFVRTWHGAARRREPAGTPSGVRGGLRVPRPAGQPQGQGGAQAELVPAVRKVGAWLASTNPAVVDILKAGEFAVCVDAQDEAALHNGAVVRPELCSLQSPRQSFWALAAVAMWLLSACSALPCFGIAEFDTSKSCKSFCGMF
jgi:hypothetical protein